MECTLHYNNQGVFIGQHLDGKPNGYVRVIHKNGWLYEGIVVDNNYNGWGRMASKEDSYIGWWKDSQLIGNSRKYHKGEKESEGWCNVF